MLYLLAVILLPPVLVFSLYHLGLWLGVPGMRRQVFWRRVAVASALAHVLLATAFFLFVWLDYRASASISNTPASLADHLFGSGDFLAVLWLMDPLPTVLLAGILGAMDWAGGGRRLILPVAIATVLAAGTLQWYWVGGGLAAAFERIWAALRTPGDDLPDWF